MREKKINVDLDEVMNKISTAVNAAITGEGNLAMISTVKRIAANRKMSVVTRGNETLQLRNNLKGTGGPNAQNLAGHWHSRIKHSDELSLGYYKLRADAARA